MFLANGAHHGVSVKTHRVWFAVAKAYPLVVHPPKSSLCMQTPALKMDSSLGDFFSASTGFPVIFTESVEDSSASIDIMEMSAGDLVSVGGAGTCPWDGTSSLTQHSTPSFPKSAMEEQFAADLVADNRAQRDHVTVTSDSDRSAATGQVAVSEQASQTGFQAPTEQNMHSRCISNSNGSLLSMHSTGQKRYLATLDELAGLLLPQSCRVAARVSTKLPPLDHDPMLPPLPEGFVLPPEMHPVVGAYTTTRAKTSTTGSQTAWNVSSAAHMSENSGAGGKWLHLKQGPSAPKAR